MSSDYLAILAVVLPCLVLSATFFVRGRRTDGVDRRKYTVGGVMFLLCAVFGSLVAWTLIALGPPGT